MSWFSYIFPQTVARFHSPFNGEIRIVESFGKYEVMASGVMQSGPWFLRMWKQVFDGISTSIINPNKILVLGIGGGDVIRAVKQRYPRVHIDVVEIDPVMITISKRYFGIEKLHEVTIHRADAQLFVRKVVSQNHPYDVIIIDLYRGDQIPNFVSEHVFLVAIKAFMSTSGLLIVNYSPEKSSHKSLMYMHSKLTRLFQSVGSRKIGNNFFLYASPYHSIP